MVGFGIAEPEIGKRRLRDLADIDEAKDEREERNCQQQIPPAPRHRGASGPVHILNIECTTDFPQWRATSVALR
jgi:hypothetical protein